MSFRSFLRLLPVLALAALSSCASKPQGFTKVKIYRLNQMDRVIAAFNPLEGRRIVVPSHEGRRGNPVLWGRDFFGELEVLTGDQGGKPLLEAHAEWVVDIEAGSDTVHRDFDVPGDLEAGFPLSRE